jgi:ribosome-associated protein
MSENKAVFADSTRLCETIVALLEDSKGADIVRMDVSKLTTMADYMIVVSGTSSRHVKALAANTIDGMRERGIRPKGVEGEEDGEWILLDYGDVIIHIMQRAVREHYDLEGLWQSGFNEVLLTRARDMAD